MESLCDLFLQQEELMKQTFYNQPACDEVNGMIKYFIEKLSIQEVNQAYELFRIKRMA